MTNLRTLIAASALALAAATGSAIAAPAVNTNVSVESTTESSIEQATYFGGYGYNRLCYLPFHFLARMYGFHMARMIKWRCRYSYSYGYNYYNYGSNYGNYGSY